MAQPRLFRLLLVLALVLLLASPAFAAGRAKKGRVKIVQKDTLCSTLLRTYYGGSSTKFVEYNGRPCNGRWPSTIIVVP
ncbi:hypothetical protein CLOM_g22900 [Closterium sp. NIES-68]|nr:hypothetical protein CLOM_g22900 [Closterium sp. NIES-68]GJP85424.1 hypothetical protein CLOP_g15535 [Closterium sp. NIES-67]